jgi:predicted branched-subunit amino acid permease
MGGNSWDGQRRHIVRDSVGVGVAVGTFGLSFGALAVAAGFSIAQAVVLSAVMFTGGSQFAYIGVIGAGGSAWAASAAALLLGARNTIYGMGMAPVLKVFGLRDYRRVVCHGNRSH